MLELVTGQVVIRVSRIPRHCWGLVDWALDCWARSARTLSFECLCLCSLFRNSRNSRYRSSQSTARPLHWVLVGIFFGAALRHTSDGPRESRQSP